jgi:hypothetical protein
MINEMGEVAERFPAAWQEMDRQGAEVGAISEIRIPKTVESLQRYNSSKIARIEVEDKNG